MILLWLLFDNSVTVRYPSLTIFVPTNRYMNQIPAGGHEMSQNKAVIDDGAWWTLWRSWMRIALQIVLGVSILWPYTFSYSAQGTTFTLVNRTPYFLHAVINNKPSVYIPPGAVVNYDAGGLGNVVVEARYSPGQTVNGSAMRTFEIVYHTTGSGSQDISSTCTGQGNTCDSSTESSVTTSADPVKWVVTESDLISN